MTTMKEGIPGWKMEGIMIGAKEETDESTKSIKDTHR
jgi:hypothetical protein